MRYPFWTIVTQLVMLPVVGSYAAAQTRSQSGVKVETFDHDPGWDSHNNRIVPNHYSFVVQDFGYSRSNVAGKARGEIGGQVTRASEPAYYADKLGRLTLDNKLSASGTFALTKTTGGAGMFFGFFRAEQPGASGRPISSLGLDFDCEKTGARLAVRLITGKNQSCGTFVTPFIPGKYRPTPLRPDGTRYTWTLDYDPNAAEGRGRIVFTIHGDAPKPGELERRVTSTQFKKEIESHFPNTTSFAIDLPRGFKQQRTMFDHFGLMNAMKPGGNATIYFDDLEYMGKLEDFSQDPDWDAIRNSTSYRETDVGGAHNFGFSKTNYAGGKTGEVGGTIWRGGKNAYYADRVGPLTLDNRLEASGRVNLKVGGPDSDMFLGWFNSANKDDPSADLENFLGVHIGGPTRVGHYFQPAAATADGHRAKLDGGPVMSQGRRQRWSIVYDPAADNGNGTVHVTLDDQSITLHFKKGFKSRGAQFNRFGMFNSTLGGQMVKLYIDDIKYTAATAAR
ncbi:MAG TPA: hypothetical protein VFW73_10785 [Lacipirellulaceae bacterium]|nr:hypothetical protein [Lacipirellulaceae bacterium]